MSIQELGSLGELVAAIATLATLIYLALQIRHNTNAVAGATELDINREITAWHARITADPELMLLYEKGAQNEPMSESEAIRYRWLVAELIWFYEGVFRQHIVSKGGNRDTAWYSMIDSEWPDLKRSFEAWLEPSNFELDGRQKNRLEDIRTAQG